MSLDHNEIVEVAKETAKQESYRTKWFALIPASLALIGWIYTLGGQSQELHNIRVEVDRNSRKADKVLVIQNDIQHIKKTLNDLRQTLSGNPQHQSEN